MRRKRPAARRGNVMGGPAACFAPAESRSDKKPRHASSILSSIGLHHQRQFALEPAWRSLLSLRDPTALTGRSGHPTTATAAQSRRGLSLFEVVIALTIFACSMGAIGHLISTGVRAAVRSRLESQAILRSESKMAEVAAGITPLQNTSGVAFPDDSAWNWSMSVSSGQFTDLYVVEVTATHSSASNIGKISYSLRRLVRDPQLEMLAYEKQLAATQASQSSSSSTSSSGSSTGTSK